MDPGWSSSMCFLSISFESAKLFYTVDIQRTCLLKMIQSKIIENTSKLFSIFGLCGVSSCCGIFRLHSSFFISSHDELAAYQVFWLLYKTWLKLAKQGNCFQKFTRASCSWYIFILHSWFWKSKVEQINVSTRSSHLKPSQ